MKMFLKIYLITTLIAILVTIQVNGQPSCIDEDGNRVDWYIAYKFPDLTNQPKPFNTGFAHAYITSETILGRKPGYSNDRHAQGNNRLNISQWLDKYVTANHRRSNQSALGGDEPTGRKADNEPYWIVSAKLITDPNSAIMKSLNIAYDSKSGPNSAKINTIMYNDAPPSKEDEEVSSNSRRAHAKGVLVMDDITGDSIWMTHSTPQFPPERKSKLEFGPNSKKFGQTFMCISFNLRQFGKQIVDHLNNMHPLVYDYHVSDRLSTLVPQIDELRPDRDNRRRRVKNETVKLAQRIKTKAGQELYIFSKSPDFGEDLYSDWIDGELKTTLFVETWRNGAGTPLNSSCPRNEYHVNNVHELIINDGPSKLTWSYHQDHSKWAISEDKNPGIVCISDINRMRSQFRRGGGAVCIKCQNCWSVFSKTILDLEPCPNSNRLGINI